jgi:hypothetical protein
MQTKSKATASAESTSKVCCECGKQKSLTAFLPCKAMPDGATATCKPCVWARASRYRVEREARKALALKRELEDLQWLDDPPVGREEI